MIDEPLRRSIKLRLSNHLVESFRHSNSKLRDAVSRHAPEIVTELSDNTSTRELTTEILAKIELHRDIEGVIEFAEKILGEKENEDKTAEDLRAVLPRVARTPAPTPVPAPQRPPSPPSPPSSPVRVPQVAPRAAKPVATKIEPVARKIETPARPPQGGIERKRRPWTKLLWSVPALSGLSLLYLGMGGEDPQPGRLAGPFTATMLGSVVVVEGWAARVEPLARAPVEQAKQIPEIALDQPKPTPTPTQRIRWAIEAHCKVDPDLYKGRTVIRVEKNVSGTVNAVSDHVYLNADPKFIACAAKWARAAMATDSNKTWKYAISCNFRRP